MGKKLINELEKLYKYYSEIKISFDKESKEYLSLIWYRDAYKNLMNDLGLTKRGGHLICKHCKNWVAIQKIIKGYNAKEESNAK